MSEDSNGDSMPENSSQLGPSALLNTPNNKMENVDISTESLANKRTSIGDPASIPPVIDQLLRMLEAAKTRRSGNQHSTDGSFPAGDGAVHEDPSTERVS